MPNPLPTGVFSIFAIGMPLVAGAPIYAGDALVGVLNIGGESDSAVPSLGEQAKLMAAAIDYASILTAVAGPALADRRETGEVRARLKRDLTVPCLVRVISAISW